MRLFIEYLNIDETNPRFNGLIDLQQIITCVPNVEKPKTNEKKCRPIPTQLTEEEYQALVNLYSKSFISQLK